MGSLGSMPYMTMTTLKKARSSAGPVCYSPMPAQGRLCRKLQTQCGTRMASARRGESTTDDAMAVEMDRKSSGQHDSSDNDGEAADFNPRVSIRKKCSNANTMMTMTMMVLFPRLSLRDRPNLIHLLLVMMYKIIKQQDRGAFNTLRCNMKTESIKRFPVPAMLRRARR
jgi:hypothetical protein